MRRNIIILIASILLVPGLSLAEERVTQFDSNLNVSRSGIVTVRETLTYDFVTTERHGIYRNIPTRSDNRHTPIKVVGVDVDGSPTSHYTTSSSTSFRKVKIGDPDQTITGQHTYAVVYEVRNAVNWFDGQPELYWNARVTAGRYQSTRSKPRSTLRLAQRSPTRSATPAPAAAKRRTAQSKWPAAAR